MPYYVTIRNKKTGRTMGINADIWAIEKERNKANKDYEFEEVQPVTVTIPRKVEKAEKKSQDVAVNASVQTKYETIPNTEK